MTTDRPQGGEAANPDDVLRDAIVVAVQSAPAPDEWDDVVERSSATNGNDSRKRRSVLVGAAAVMVVLAGAGGVFVFTQADPQSVRTDDPTVTSQPKPTTIADSDVTTAPESGDAGQASVEASLPMLADSLTEVWSTTIEGGYPQSAVRIGETLVFGQQGLPGVRAVDARSGDVLWSFTLDDPGATVVDLGVIGGYAIVRWFDGAGTQLVTALNTDGAEVWTEAFASTAFGSVIRVVSGDAGDRLEVLAPDGSVRRSIEYDVIVSTRGGQLVVRRDEGLTWYRMPELEQIAGPIGIDPPPFVTVAVGNGVVAIDDKQLRFLDQTGELRSTLEIGEASTLEAVEGERPGVIVVVADDPQSNVGGRLEGTTAFYELVDDTITPVWTRHGFFEELVEVDERTFVVHTDIGVSADTSTHIIDPTTGESVVSNDLYDTPGVADGFVFTQLDDGPDDIQTVAYDLDGEEKWRLQLDGREGAEIVDDGVLIGDPDTVAETVDLTFYSDPDRVGPATDPSPSKTVDTRSTTSPTGPVAVAEGRSGGPLRDQGCDWALVPLTYAQAVSMQQETLTGSSSHNVFADGADDALWVNQTVLCSEGPTIAFGGARADVTRVVVESPDGEQVELDFFDVPGETWRAVKGELPRTWRAYSPLGIAVIATIDETVLDRERYQN